MIALAERGPDPEINGRYFSRFKVDGRENKQASDQSVIDVCGSARQPWSD
jgi:hypothetical protein